MSFTKNPKHLYQNTRSGRWKIVCRDGSTELFYRAVMAAHLGRDLAPGEQVHHINGDPSDDRIENLQLMSIGDHTRLHLPQLQAARRAARRFEWSRNYPACRECGTVESAHYCTGLCRPCYHRLYMRRRRAAQGASA